MEAGSTLARCVAGERPCSRIASVSSCVVVRRRRPSTTTFGDDDPFVRPRRPTPHTCGLGGKCSRLRVRAGPPVRVFAAVLGGIGSPTIVRGWWPLQLTASPPGRGGQRKRRRGYSGVRGGSNRCAHNGQLVWQQQQQRRLPQPEQQRQWQRQSQPQQQQQRQRQRRRARRSRTATAAGRRRRASPARQRWQRQPRFQ